MSVYHIARGWLRNLREPWKWGKIGFGSLILMMWAFIALSVVILVVVVQEPRCPTEDSCSVEWRNGEWHIEEVEP